MTTPPPPHLQYAYRLLGIRLPDEYREWVAQDIASKSFLNWRIARRLLGLLVAVGLYAVGQASQFRWPAQKTMFRLVLFAFAVSLLSSGPRLARAALRWQRIDKHGRPVPPRGMGLLDAREGVLLTVLAAVAITNASVLFGYGLRPTGVAGIPCDQPEDDVRARLMAGVTHKGAQLSKATSIKYRNGEVVAALLVVPPADPETPPKELSIETWLIQDEQVYSIRKVGTSATDAQKVPPSWASFPDPPAADRVAVDARNRALVCLTQQVTR